MRCRRPRRIPVAAVGSAFLLLLTGCSGSENTSVGGDQDETPDTSTGGSPTNASEGTPDTGTEPAAAPETPQLSVGIIPISNLTPVHVAQQEGFFEEVGLDVETSTGSAGAGLAAALQGGSLDLAYTNYVSVFQANAQGFPLTIVAHQNSAGSQEPDAAALIVKADSSITGPQDLAGGRIGINALNNINYLAARYWLEQAGVDVDTVEFAEVPFPSMGDALDRGDVDAAYQVEPFVTILTNSGRAKPLAYPFIHVAPGLPIAGYVATKEFADANPRTLQAFADALAKANELLNGDDELRRQYVAEFTNSDLELVRTITLDQWSVTFDDLESLQKLADLSLEYGLQPSPTDVTAIVSEFATE